MILEYVGPFLLNGEIGIETVARCRCDYCNAEWKVTVRTLKRYKNSLPLGAICRTCSTRGEPLGEKTVYADYPNIVEILETGVRGGVTTSSHVLAQCSECNRVYRTKFELIKRGASKCRSCQGRHGGRLEFPFEYPDLRFDTQTLGLSGQVRARTIVIFNCLACGEVARSYWCNFRDGTRLCRGCSNKLPPSPDGARRISEAHKKNWATEDGRERYITGRENATWSYSRTMSGTHKKLKELMIANGLTTFLSEKWVARGIRVDEVDFDRKMVIELNGDYFHANPNRFGPNDTLLLNGTEVPVRDIWERERIRTNRLQELGYQVIVIWESELKQLGSRVLERIP